MPLCVGKRRSDEQLNHPEPSSPQTGSPHHRRHVRTHQVSNHPLRSGALQSRRSHAAWFTDHKGNGLGAAERQLAAVAITPDLSDPHHTSARDCRRAPIAAFAVERCAGMTDTISTIANERDCSKPGAASDLPSTAARQVLAGDEPHDR